MKILLTGATGLIGKELGKKLVEQGHSLHVLTRDIARAKLEVPFPAEFFSWKGEQEEIPLAALENVEAVIHLAGEPIANKRWSSATKMRIYQSRVLGTRRLVDAIDTQIKQNNSKLRHFISASAIGIYGDRNDEIISEKDYPGSDFLAQVCKDWELETKRLEGAVAIRVAQVRVGIVLSRQGGALEKMLPIFSLGLGGALGNGKQWMSWIHLDDLICLFLFVLENPQIRGPINAVAPNPVTNLEFSKLLASALHKNIFLPVPGMALRILMGEIAEILLAGQRVIPAQITQFGFRFRFENLRDAVEEICQPLHSFQREFLSEQWVPHPVKKIFAYFCDEKNLEQLTPDFLHFKVLNKSTAEIKEGTLIEYSLRLHGIPLRWKTKIEKWQPPQVFIDTQLKGPYEKWHHTHEFMPLYNGTLIRDRVYYRLPFGMLGSCVAGWKVAMDVREIFSYRKKKIQQVFD